MSNSRDNLDNMDRDQIKNMSDEARDDLNADPITGEPGSHPVGTGVGSAGGAAAGAAIGAVAGPIGAMVGGVIGAIAGAAAGHAAGEAVNPTEEEAYWRENHRNTAYYQSDVSQHPDLDYDRDYSTAYRVGYENRAHYNDNHRFEDAETDLSRKWDEVKGDSRLKWEQAKHATRDAWDRATTRTAGSYDTTRNTDDNDLNRDPITGEPGSHPVGTGVGGIGGAAAGAAIGSVAGPVGTVVGGAIGAVAGGVAGHAAGEAVNPTEEDAYWRSNYATTPYYSTSSQTYSDLDYDRDYSSAYRLGYENRAHYDRNQRFEDVENDMANKWDHLKGESRLKWDEAKMATRDAWNRATR
ncbi:MAG: hypothetical protein EOO69_08480 [Moraxellaceae bacterium]|nr:MAG: hypothetical protein EOO69_08480 [Moraxellaceae bacterium]